MKIVIYDWNDGFNKVQFSKHLRKEYGYNIREAFLIVTDIVQRKEVCLSHDKSYDPKSLLDDFKLKYRIE